MLGDQYCGVRRTYRHKSFQRQSTQVGQSVELGPPPGPYDWGLDRSLKAGGSALAWRSFWHWLRIGDSDHDAPTSMRLHHGHGASNTI